MVRSGSESVKIVLRSLVLGLLLGLLSRRVALALFNCYSSSCKPMSADAWKLLYSAFSRHTLFFVVNTVVLLVLVPSGFFSPSRGAQVDQTAHTHKLQTKKVQAAAQQWKTSGRGPFRNKLPDLLKPKAEGKDLSLSLVEMSQDQKKKQCLFPNQASLTHRMSSTAAVHSPSVHRNEVINGELDDLNERIEAFIAKVRREMMLQERQRIS